MPSTPRSSSRSVSDPVDQDPNASFELFTNHEAALSFLNSKVNFERSRPKGTGGQESFKLKRMHALLKVLGDPHFAVPMVHIAGSKGKGSVCSMLSSCLVANGYTTGMFTSPHLIDERERIQLSGEPVSEAVFDHAIAQCRDASLVIEDEHGEVTYFEMLTAAAFVVFAQEAVDLAVIETGMGGRLDSTNVVRPVAVGLTAIHLEHTEVLGETLEAIAGEKGGIIKSGVPAITVPQQDSVIEVFRECAKSVGAPLKVLGEDIIYTCRFQASGTRGPHPRVCVGEMPGGYEHLSVPLFGEHQAGNCGLVLAILLELIERGFDLPEPRVVAGLAQSSNAGKLELVHNEPRIYIDGAHTPESIHETLRAAGAHLEYDSLVVVFGCNRDKRAQEMVDKLDRGADKVIFTRASSTPRAMDPEQLREMFLENKKYPGMVHIEPSAKEAINNAVRAVTSHDLILVLGSFYLAGEVKALLQAAHAKAGDPQK
ncbi:MAG: bifunctional folylpolyglutamate synthase/dihydrofolate synthase [Phycisphaerales bacterium]|nr:bifunctional folylpolyglutamate synthase/dihydrofolate synthase [Phycisphaerales bacterium]